MGKTLSRHLSQSFSSKQSNLETVVYVSSFPPRECGVATFTQDLVSAMDRQFSSVIKSKILALNENATQIYNYPDKVFSHITVDDKASHLEAAYAINIKPEVKLVSIQHEFGLYGGQWGDHLLTFLEALQKPVVITFHTVLPPIDARMVQVVKNIARRVDEIVVMTKTGVDILKQDYDIKTPIHIIPHGIPGIVYESQQRMKKKMRLKGRFVLSSFGLLGPGKGYEFIIGALSELVKEYHDLIYIIVGATHPVVRKKEGEKYRNSLKKIIEDNNLKAHVRFDNRYVDINEIIEYLAATDIYISSSQNPYQITSGTLAYALGSGRPVVSTPFAHAKDLVTSACGRLAEFGNSTSFSRAISEMMAKPNKLKEMEHKAYALTRPMEWPNTALAYGKLFSQYLNFSDIRMRKLPAISLRQVKNLTDSFGMIQFSKCSYPDIESGYTLDDNARALIAVSKYYSNNESASSLKLIKIYLDFLKYIQDEDGKLYNYVTKDKQLLKEQWIEDAHARGIWALGCLSASKSCPKELRSKAGEVLAGAVKHIENTTSPRTAGFTILGLVEYEKASLETGNQKIIKNMADFLVSLYKKYSSKDWKWFEHIMAYSNATLCEAMFGAFEITKDKTYLQVGTETLDFLIATTFENHMFVPIGQDGWYSKGSKRQYYDQQPIEADTTVSALAKAYQVTGEEKYPQYAISAFNWFLGENMLGQFLYNEKTGGCYDGLQKKTVNLNQGAESTLAYLHARLVVPEL